MYPGSGSCLYLKLLRHRVPATEVPAHVTFLLKLPSVVGPLGTVYSCYIGVSLFFPWLPAAYCYRSSLGAGSGSGEGRFRLSWGERYLHSKWVVLRDEGCIDML